MAIQLDGSLDERALAAAWDLPDVVQYQVFLAALARIRLLEKVAGRVPAKEIADMLLLAQRWVSYKHATLQPEPDPPEEKCKHCDGTGREIYKRGTRGPLSHSLAGPACKACNGTGQDRPQTREQEE